MIAMDILIRDGVKYFQTDFHGKESELKKLFLHNTNIFLEITLFCLRREKFKQQLQ